MAHNKQNERRFDEMLKKNLKAHCEPIRPDFVQRLVAKIKELEQQNALKKVIRQERLLFAAFILVPLTAISVMFAFPGMITETWQFLSELPELAGQILTALAKQWQVWIYYVPILFGCLYAIYEMLAMEN